jgi:hypothetical protein
VVAQIKAARTRASEIREAGKLRRSKRRHRQCAAASF